MSIFIKIASWAVGKVPWLAAPWVKWVAYGLIVSAIYYAGFHTSSVIQQAHEAKVLKQQYDKLNKDIRDRHEADLEQYADDAKLLTSAALERDAWRAKYETLQDAARHGSLVNHSTEVVKDDKGQHTCADTTRTNQFRLCYNAAQTGDPAAIAACQAGGLPHPVPSQ